MMRKFMKIVITFCILFPPPSSAYSSNQTTDHLSLLAIKSELQDPQGSLSSWNQTLHFCSWKGIRCGRRHPDRVISIDLTSRGLVGTLSPHVGNLSFLTNLLLTNNSFHGPIPPQITLLSRLQFLDFRNNTFMGEIPTNLSRCPNLVELVLTNNLISGTVPSELGFLSKLEALYLSRNNISGLIPSSIGNITSLTTLSLGSCSFNGEIPASLGNLSRLEFLQLSQNNLTGMIPSGLFNLSRMEYFDVSVNNLHGVIPSTVGVTLPKLAVLLLEQNHFNGPIPNSLSNASLIEWIVLSSNRFTGPVPNLESLTLIQDFYLSSNLIEDGTSFLSSLTNSTQLQHLDVSNNMFRGPLPDSVANLSVDLSMFYINNNKIHGKIPLGIGRLVNLDVFDLSRNLLDGPIPFDMSKLSNVQTIFLGRNRLGGEVPSIFGNMTLLSRFRLEGNEFSGNVPLSLGNCTHLLELDLSENNFTGSIPPEILRLSSIAIVLNLSHNAYVGSIPYEVGSLTNLVALDLSSNRLSGVIPKSLSSCVSMEKLYLNENLLEGELPQGMSALMGLQDLDLSKNGFSGTIPTFLATLKLEKLNLSFNRLHGEIPSRGVFQNRTSISLDGNQGLCGGNTELMFPPCKREESNKRKLSTLLKILIPVSVVGGICIMLLVFFTCKRERNRTSLAAPNDTIGAHFVRLSYADLLKATNGFSESNLVGFGRFGYVYKGILNDENTLVAVKVLNLAVEGANKTFMAECKALGGLRHRNLVKLITVCDSVDFQGSNFKAIVYDFKVNGSLEQWLHNNSKENPEKNGEEIRNLTIFQKLNAAIDIARGVEYLHFGTGSSIIHGDLKPSNILFDDEMVSCVGDFGLAKIVSNTLPTHETNSSIGIKGTLGYVPPEYGTFASASTQGDVYSYGIILLEMFTNKRPTDDIFYDHLNLHDYVSSALPNRLMEVVDPQVQMEMLVKGKNADYYIARILSIGVSCSKENPRDRMQIYDVVKELSSIQKLLCS